MHKETIPIVKSLLISLNWNHEKVESYNYLKQKNISLKEPNFPKCRAFCELKIKSHVMMTILVD